MIEEITVQLSNKKVITLIIIENELNGSLPKENYLEEVTKELTSRNYTKSMGFDSQNKIKEFLKFCIFGENNLKESIKLNKDNLKDVISEILKRCDFVLNDEDIQIFVFPTLNEVTINKMSGVGGFCTRKNTILITIYPKKDYTKYLEMAIIHELAHSLSSYYDMESLSIGEGLIFDGLAEHFRESIMGREKSPLIKSTSKEKAIDIFIKLKTQLSKRDSKVYNEVFFGTGKYNLWAGYAIGYYIIDKYLKNQKSLNWKDILRKNPQEILKEVITYF